MAEKHEEMPLKRHYLRSYMVVLLSYNIGIGLQ